jgi:hypothetical protein
MSIVEQLYFTFVSFRVQMGNCLRAELNEPLTRLMREKERLDDEIHRFSSTSTKDKQSLHARSRALELVVQRSRVEERIRLHLRTPGVRGK